MTEPAAPPAPPPLPPVKERARALLKAFSRPLLIVAAFFLLFFLARLAVLVLHSRDFASLTAGDVAFGFLRGLRFDAAIIFLIAGIPIFLLTLPFPWTQGRLWQGIWGWACFAILVGFFLVLSIDVIYFGYVHRHIGPEVTILGEAFEAVALSAARQYVLPVLSFLAAVAGLAWGWRRLMKRETPPVADRGLRIAAALVLFAVMYAGARGSLTGKRMKVVHAFQGVPHAAAYLALNGPFSALHSVDDRRPLRTDFYPWPEAVRTAQEVLFASDENPTDADFPLLRSRPARASMKPNVVLVMLESWDAYSVDAHRRELGLEPLGMTPRYDAIAREGVLFSRFYAAGQKSMDGMCALVCGFPTLPRTPYLGRGMEQSALPFLGHLAKQEGYETLFIQASKRESFRNDAVAALAGFGTYLGAEDVPPEPAEGAGRAILNGACWDHEMFDEANRRLAAAKGPFLAFLYTASTHAPYSWPRKKWERFPPDSAERRYLDSLGYADWALGRFFEGAKAAGWFDRTIFILTSDHVGGPVGATLERPESLHHVPALVIAPGLPPGVARTIGSQLDVIPTIAERAGWGVPQSALGRSLFSDPGPHRGAFCVQGEVILRVEEGGCVVHNFQARTAGKAYAAGADLDAVERRLLSVFQVGATLLRQNRLYRPN